MKRGKFISIPRLFGPDFYLDPNPNPLDQQIGHKKLSSAVATIQASTKAKKDKYNNWIDTLYKRQLGKTKYEEILDYRRETEEDPKFHKSSAGKARLEKDKNDGNNWQTSDYDEDFAPALDVAPVPAATMPNNNIQTLTSLQYPAYSSALLN